MGLTSASRHGPVDESRIITWLVRPGFAQLGAMAREQPGVVTLQQPVQAIHDGQAQACQRRLGGRGGLESPLRDGLDVTRRPGAPGADHLGSVDGTTVGAVILGAATVVSSSTSTSSTVTPSATASKDSTSR